MRKFLIVIFAVSLSGCVAPARLYKNNVSQQEVNQDHYACMKEAQQRVSGATVNMYGGVASNQVITNQNLYNACMLARGYEWRRPSQ